MEENKKKKRTAGDVIRTLIMIVALGVFCYSGYQLLSIYQEYKKGSDEYHALENKYIDEKGMFEEINTDAAEPTMKNPIDFAGLKAVNEDIIAWLKVGAIDISYKLSRSWKYAIESFVVLHDINIRSERAGISVLIFIVYFNIFIV